MDKPKRPAARAKNGNQTTEVLPPNSGGQVPVPVSVSHKVVVAEKEVMSKERREHQERQGRLRRAEDELLTSALDRMEHAINFSKIPFDATEVPKGYYDLYGDRAEEVFRIQKAGQMSAKTAPVGLMLAQRMAAGIIKARATEKGESKPLGVQIQIVTSAPVFDEKEVEQ